MSFKPAYADAQSVPRVLTYPISTSTYAENEGALVILTSGAAVACGADPAAVYGVAVGAGGADSGGFNITARKEFPRGFLGVYPVYGGVPFRARYIGTLPANVGASYGVVRDSDGYWKVDFGETTNLVVRLERILNVAPESIPEVVVTFLPTVAVPPS